MDVNPNVANTQPAFPVKKVALGGWLLFFFILNCLGLASSVVSLFGSIIMGTFSVLQMLITAVTSILPAVMIIYFMVQRDIRFKKWFYFQSVLMFLSYLMLLVSAILLLIVAGNAGPELMAEVQTYVPYFTTYMLSIAGVVLLVSCFAGVGMQIAWLVYFNKSRRVAYTFDPRNNPSA